MNDIPTIGGFKKFVKSSNRIIDKISITSGGAIGFSTSFADEHELSNFSGIILYWNSETKEIGIQFTATTGEEIIKLMTNAHAGGRTANAKSFFALNRIDINRYKGRKSYRMVTFNQLDANNPSNDKMYIIRLEDHIPQVAVAPIPTSNPAPSISPQVPAPETVTPPVVAPVAAPTNISPTPGAA